MTQTYGPSNDSPPEVQIEIRAAELAHRPMFEYSYAEIDGWSAWRRRGETPENDSAFAGWLSREIEESESEVEDGQAAAVRYRPGAK